MTDDLRARIAEALTGVWLHLGPNAIVLAQAGRPLRLSGGERDQISDAVLVVVQPELDRLNAELHRHAACALCGHERHRHGYEAIIRRDWCADCPTANDLHTFEAKESLS